jgi:hypothetical protein
MKGMIFTAESVLAIEAGTKTQSRRLARLPDAPNNLGSWEPTTIGGPGCTDKRGKPAPLGTAIWHTRTGVTIASPYVVGELVYVKEAWQTGISLDDKRPEQIATACVDAGYSTPWAPINFVAGGSKRNAQLLGDFGAHWGRVRSPIHMPRWVSRFTLQITEVRAQPVQEISDDDAKAEGVDPYTPPHGHISPDQRVPGPGFDRVRLGDQPHRLPFADRWDAINGNRCAWESNPLVFAYTFIVKERR